MYAQIYSTRRLVTQDYGNSKLIRGLRQIQIFSVSIVKLSIRYVSLYVARCLRLDEMNNRPMIATLITRGEEIEKIKFVDISRLIISNLRTDDCDRMQ